MFEKFTEKAINVVGTSQNIAKEIGAIKVTPELLLLALFDEAKGFSLKIFKNYNIARENLIFVSTASFVVTPMLSASRLNTPKKSF